MLVQVSQLSIRQSIQHSLDAGGNVVLRLFVFVFVYPLLTCVARRAGGVGLLDPVAIEDNVSSHCTRLLQLVASSAGKAHRGILLLQLVSGLSGSIRQVERLDRRIGWRRRTVLPLSSRCRFEGSYIIQLSHAHQVAAQRLGGSP